MEYLTQIAWFSLWPLVIFLGWKLSIKNALNFESKLK